MASRVFPVFRSLQRAMGGCADVCPVLAPARSFQARQEEAEDDEIDKGSEEVRFREGKWPEIPKGGEGIVISDPKTWPINSEKARQMRRAFVQEGFRRLYNQASNPTDVAEAGAADDIQNNYRHQQNDGSRGVAEPTNANEGVTAPTILGNAGDEAMYYAQ